MRHVSSGLRVCWHRAIEGTTLRVVSLRVHDELRVDSSVDEQIQYLSGINIRITMTDSQMSDSNPANLKRR